MQRADQDQQPAGDELPSPPDEDGPDEHHGENAGANHVCLEHWTPHPRSYPFPAPRFLAWISQSSTIPMHQEVGLGELLSRGVALEAHEAVAVAQLVIANAGRGPVE